mgnify:CR=1 FL=1
MTKTTPFQERVYAKLRDVPMGRITTYADLAHALGIDSPHAIGQALRRNPYAPAVPCHRVVASDGSIGGFMGARTGAQVTKKIGLLENEGIAIEKGRVKEFLPKRHVFTRQS